MVTFAEFYLIYLCSTDKSTASPEDYILSFLDQHRFTCRLVLFLDSNIDVINAGLAFKKV